MQKPVQIEADLYARAAAAASREGKHVDNCIHELIRLQIREAERLYLVARALDEIAIKATHQAMPKASNSRRNLHEQEAPDERSNTKIRIAEDFIGTDRAHRSNRNDVTRLHRQRQLWFRVIGML